MPVEYAPRGLIGVLTPQANTTVEPEFSVLWPAGIGMINGRLMSLKGTIEARLVDYVDQLDEAVKQFANAPIDAIAIACTALPTASGSSARPKRWLGSQRTGVPAFTAAIAVVDALNALGARRIGLVTPYPEALTTASVAYWTARGFTVAAVASATADWSQFSPDLFDAGERRA